MTVKTKRHAAMAAVVAAGIAASGCADFNNAETGTLVGTVAGGVIGNQFGRGSGKVLATAAGIFIGGIVGHSIGRRMDEHDRMMAQRAEFHALENGRSGEPTEWRNPDSGHYGEVYPEPAYRDAGRLCRSYRHTVIIDGQRETMRGRACRQADGTWEAIG